MRHALFVSFVLSLAGCGEGTSTSPAVAATAPVATAPAVSVPVADAGAVLEGLVLRYAPGGARPDRFCVPEWSITNQTGTDLSGLMIRIEWQDAAGNVLQPVGEFGTLWEDLVAGKRHDRTLNGHPIDCRELRIIVGRYACRDENASHLSCPGPLHVLTEGGIEADTTGIEEGALPGFPGPRR